MKSSKTVKGLVAGLTSALSYHRECHAGFFARNQYAVHSLPLPDFELRLEDTTANKSKPMLDSVDLTFRPQGLRSE